MNERLYLFNPFRIKEWENIQIKEQLDVLISSYEVDACAPSQYAGNIENLANQLYLIGEMIARLYEDVNVMKADVSNEENLQVYKQRDVYEKTHEGKPPAMIYFQALASDFVKDKRVAITGQFPILQLFFNISYIGNLFIVPFLQQTAFCVHNTILRNRQPKVR